MLILDKLFLKYEDGGEGGRVKLTTPPEKLPSKSPALLELRVCVWGEGAVWVFEWIR